MHVLLFFVPGNRYLNGWDRGYFGFDPVGGRDEFKERFDMGPPYQTSADNDNLVVGTPWPKAALDSPPFVQLMTEHYHAMNELGTTCMRLIALGLQLDVDVIAKMFNQPVSTLRVFHYIQIPGERAQHDELLLSCLPHTDHGALTFVSELQVEDSNSVGVLELELLNSKNKKVWIPVPVRPKVNKAS